MGSVRHRVLVIGGGFGGLNVTEALADADVDVTPRGSDQSPSAPAAAVKGSGEDSATGG